ncbi:MAG: hypothetical protein AMXMBFR20_28130 [Planctomycetia bacterium]
MRMTTSRPTMSFARSPSRLFLFVALLAATTTAAADAPDFKVVRLAGTFNNWATGDNDFALKRRGQSLELTRFWECGSYSCKFVFDGSWNRHLGSAGDDRLVQPGSDIRLTIPQSAVYRIWLDVDKKTWGMEQSLPKKPVAFFRAIGEDVGAARVVLDATLSQAPRGREIKSCEWNVTSQDGLAFLEPSKPGNMNHLQQAVTVERSGNFEVSLKVSDGKQSATTKKIVRLGQGWSADLSPKSDTQDRDVTPMLPLHGNRWGTIYLSDKPGNLKVSFTPATGKSKRAKNPKKLHSKAGTQLLVYDPALHQAALTNEGFHAINFDRQSADALPPDVYVERIDVVGDFNNWTPGATPLYEFWTDDRVFGRIIELPEGRYRYKLLVNGHIWMEDPAADKGLRSPDESRGFNSGFRIGPDAAQFGAPKPDQIAARAVHHDPTNSAYIQVIDEHLIRVGLRTLADDVESAEIAIDDRKLNSPLRRTHSSDGFDYWEAMCSVDGRNIEYVFNLHDGKARSLLDSLDCYKMPTEPDAAISLKVEPFVADLRMSFDTPDWAKRTVWYQIFPERFCNGEPSNDPQRTVPWTHDWHKPYDGSSAKDAARRFKEQGSFFQYVFDRRYGGDLQGVRNKLPYLRDLGVTAIYFNPIFSAASLHKYDAADYRHIDDAFGVAGSLDRLKGETTDPKTWQWSESDKVFLDFLQEAHRQGFKVIIDGVFNHVGREFWAFQDVLKNGKKSQYADWFDITSWEPFHYKAWDRDDGALPRLKHDDALGLCKPVRDHLFAVTRRWMDPNGDGDPSDGIDGWRLDVASDINANFWRDWRKVVKTANPDAYIVAELWEESKVWLDGQTFDAVMNYPYARACQRFFVNNEKRIKPSEFDRQLREVLGWYLPQVSYVLQNLYDSHDTDRLASMLMNPDLEYDQANRLQDNGPNYNESKPTAEAYQRQKLLVTMQMTYLGAPMVYYGDEVGMFGADDPSCRKPMLWPELMPYQSPDDRIEKDLLDHYRRLIAIRNTYPALQLGTFDTLECKDDQGIFAFARSLDGQTVAVVFNNSKQSRRLNISSPWPDGAVVAHLDDPKEAELIGAPDDKAVGRPFIRLKKPAHPHVRVEGGRLRGLMLSPYTAAVLVNADDSPAPR